MNCRQARNLMHELLDGTLGDRAALDAHLAECEACRVALAGLERVDGSVRHAVRPEHAERGLEGITAAVLRGIESEQRAAPSPLRLRPWGAAAAMLAMFALGALAGRTFWPRERVVIREVPKREIVEKTVAVPVIEKRVVVKEVPVVRTRVVCRDRVVEVPVEKPVHEAARREPVKADEVVIHMNAQPLDTVPVVSEELHSVTVAETDDGPGSGTELGEPPGHDGASVPGRTVLAALSNARAGKGTQEGL